MKNYIVLIVMLLIALNMVGQNNDVKFDPETVEKAVKDNRKSSQSALPLVLSHDFKDNTYTYIGYSKNTEKVMYNNAREWIAKNFEDYNRVVKLQDAESCKIVLKGKLPPRHDMDTKKTNPEKMIVYYLNSQTEFTLTIEAKEGRYRLKFDDVAVNCSEEKEVKLRKTKSSSHLVPMSSFCSIYEEFAGRIKYDIQKLVESIKKAIETTSVNDNW